MPSKRFTKQDWLTLGLRVLKQHGPSGLTVEEICDYAQKTRGSFYFHFENVETFHSELAQLWKAEFTDSVVSATPKTNGKRDLLNQLAARLDPQLETGIRQLALLQSPVQIIVTNADTKRIDWLGALYHQTEAYTKSEADDLARLEYAAFIGFRLLDPNLTAERSKTLYEAFLRFTDRGS